MKKHRRILLVVLFTAILISVVCAAIYKYGTRYTPLYTFDENRRQKIPIASKIDADQILFKSNLIIDNIHHHFTQNPPENLKKLISHCVQITDSRLHYDTTTLLGRSDTNPQKAYRQHDADWLYQTGHANCIGYAYLFAAVFNQVKSVSPEFEDYTVRIIYQSPVTILFGSRRIIHTWNQVISEDGNKAIYIDALFAECGLPWNVTALSR